VRRQGRHRGQKRLGASFDFAGSLPDHSQRRYLIPLLEEQTPQRPFERLIDQLVEPQRAEQRIAPQTRNRFRLARQNPGLGPAQKFIAAERHQIHACLEAL